MDAQKTGTLIQSARKEKQLTQKELARRLHISDRTVSKWERGAGLPDVALWEPLADALGLPVQCLISGEAGEREPGPEAMVREAIRLACRQWKANARRRLGTLFGWAGILAILGFVLLGILDRTGFFLREVSREVPAVIYQNGEAVGQTTVIMEGERKWLGKKSFQGTFSLSCEPRTAREGVTGYIRWDGLVEGYPRLVYYRSPGLSHIETGVSQELYISPDMGEFALELEDGRIVATNPCLAALEAIDVCRYALDYRDGVSPYAFGG